MKKKLTPVRANIAYGSWHSMKKRCRPGYRFSHLYYDRGIRMVEQWNDFEIFLRDMGPKPSKAHSIERIDNDRGYEPENCKWATRKEQMINRRVTVFVEYEGEMTSLADACRRSGVHYNAAYWRFKNGHPWKDTIWESKVHSKKVDKDGI